MSRERLIWVAAGVLAVVGWQQCDAKRLRDIGGLTNQLHTLAATNRVISKRADSLQRNFRADTVRLTQTLTRREVVMDSILRVDTVVLTHRESVLVAVADTAIKACTDALNTCAVFLKAKDAQIANRDSALRVALQLRPTFGDKARSAIVWLAAGFLAAKVIK